MNSKKKFLIIVFLLFIASGFLFWKKNVIEKVKTKKQTEVENRKTENNVSQNLVSPEKQEQTHNLKNYDVTNDVPFTSQAPSGNWKDMTFQDGCEEASAIMAMAWVKNIDLPDVKVVEDQIRKITNFEQEAFGDVYDTSIFDTEKIIKNYFNYSKVEVKENISLSDIKEALVDGKLILLPTFGRALGNPNYTAPGPITHMLVVTGYDSQKQEFITNDPGTKRGQNYRYKESVLFNAIWEYQTGKNNGIVPIKKDLEKKAMIIVMKD